MNEQSQFIINQARQLRKRNNHGIAQELSEALLTLPCQLKINYGRGGCTKETTRLAYSAIRTLKLPVPCCEECHDKLSALQAKGRSWEYESRITDGVADTWQALWDAKLIGKAAHE